MNVIDPPKEQLPPVDTPPRSGARRRLVAYALFLLVLVAGFSQPLLRLIELALAEDLHSHLLLIPFVTGYLLYIRKGELPVDYRTSPTGAVLLLLGAGVSLALGFTIGPAAGLATSLACFTFALVCLINAGGFAFLGSSWMRAAVFPMAFLLFLVPLPESAVYWLETASKYASAEAAHLFFQLTGTPVLRDGLFMRLPGITLEVAQECSGIRSSWVLFITSLVASNLFLRSPWRQTVLVLFVFPLAILRNGFRILVIGLMCVHIGPEMINSIVHKRGGPAFFALSLIPLFLLAWWLRRGEVEGERKVLGRPESGDRKPESSGSAMLLRGHDDD